VRPGFESGWCRSTTAPATHLLDKCHGRRVGTFFAAPLSILLTAIRARLQVLGKSGRRPLHSMTRGELPDVPMPDTVGDLMSGTAHAGRPEQRRNSVPGKFLRPSTPATTPRSPPGSSVATRSSSRSPRPPVSSRPSRNPDSPKPAPGLDDQGSESPHLPAVTRRSTAAQRKSLPRIPSDPAPLCSCVPGTHFGCPTSQSPPRPSARTVVPVHQARTAIRTKSAYFPHVFRRFPPHIHTVTRAESWVDASKYNWAAGNGGPPPSRHDSTRANEGRSRTDSADH
jgi:hypothetical protein